MRKLIAAIAVAAAATLAAGPVQAGTVFEQISPVVDIPTNFSLTAAFASATNGGEAWLRVAGYRTLDGQNDFEDRFHLSLNGVALIEAAFDLGGGGADFVYFTPAGSTLTPHSNGLGLGGYLDVHLFLPSLVGANSLTIAYTSAAGESLADEGWGLQSLLITDFSTAVPEPSAWALLIAGFGLAGAALRGRRRGGLRIAA
jgi:hypothetical protein